ncbi:MULTISPECIES: ABC transporter substrate-binding protein [Gemella]|uniref:ABC transporter substrate-binding protein n=1 Tax=Gemella TaxID=1378 RepID=UPI0007683695|nr:MULTISPECIES: spermidine/putrescine ABC transporter substrate-binding protein [Gemella]AME09703.1 spermidine/putrescine ABC transporter substrate-binding protein [Gemella sp. oral taxon 928]AXI27305.1 spermidine/putrescine ABC transporter substrate-binding protein [Gemella sp. ND 6198]
MKKLLMTALSILIICIGLLYSRSFIDSSGGSDKQTLTIFNWGEYIDPELIKDFEKETGIKVVYETFDSNEAMLTKIQSDSTPYDIVIPSDYMIKKMKKLNLLNKIDKNKLENFDTLDPKLLDKSFDYNNEYSVPYFWGTVGILYNKNKVPKDLKFDKWNDLWDNRLQNNILLIDGAREMMGIALQSEGNSVNDTNEVNLNLAERKLELMHSNIKAINADEKKMLMINNEAWVSVVFSGDASAIMSENDELEYSVPKEGTNLWFDNIVIPKTSKNEEAAYKFINFMLKPENAAKNAEFIGYATPSLAAKKLLPKEVTDDEEFYPNLDTFGKVEVYEDLSPKMLQLYNDLFLKFKINNRQ